MSCDIDVLRLLRRLDKISNHSSALHIEKNTVDSELFFTHDFNVV